MHLTSSPRIFFSVCCAQFSMYKRISLRIKASRIITGYNSCVRTCAYAFSSSKIPILRALFARLGDSWTTCPSCLRATRSRDCESRHNLSILHTRENKLPCEKRARPRQLWRKCEIGMNFGDGYLRRTPRESICTRQKYAKLCEAPAR